MIKKEQIFKGLAASKGISMGNPFVYRAEVPSYKVDISPAAVVSADIEISDYENAISQSVKELKKIFSLAKEKLEDKNLQIFEAQLSFLQDEFFHAKVKERIRRENKQAFVTFKEEIQILENPMRSIIFGDRVQFEKHEGPHYLWASTLPSPSTNVIILENYDV